MDDLRMLEGVQRMLSLMEARGLSTSHQNSDRFLANFLLFLVQPCDILNMQQRCDLISEFLNKISSAVLEEALPYASKHTPVMSGLKCYVSSTDLPPVSCPTSEGEETVGNADCLKIATEVPSKLYLEKESLPHLPEARFDNTATIEFDAMQRANSTLEDFCRSYFMFHGMDVKDPRSIFKFLPMLYFTESYIYQLDTMNEKDLQLQCKEKISPKDSASYFKKYTGVANETVTGNCHETSDLDPFDPLVHLLQSQGLLTARIRTELDSGVEYWELERKLCHALRRKKEILIEDVMRAIHLKSFDYRVLNLLLYQLRGQEVNDLHMEFLSISEFLVEVADDLYDYEEDVMENSFNVLRMFVGVYGASKAPNMLAKCITEAEAKYEHLSKALDPELSSRYSRRCEEATIEGGTKSDHSFGTWNIPTVIMDEESFRLQIVGDSQ